MKRPLCSDHLHLCCNYFYPKGHQPPAHAVKPTGSLGFENISVMSVSGGAVSVSGNTECPPSQG